jgi:prophage regulatory protein
VSTPRGEVPAPARGTLSLDNRKRRRLTSVRQVEDLVGVTEIGEMLGVSRQRADQLSRTEGFPEPIGTIAAGRIWRLVDVEAWARETGRLS